MHFNEVCVVTGVFDQSPLCLLSVFLVFPVLAQHKIPNAHALAQAQTKQRSETSLSSPLSCMAYALAITMDATQPTAPSQSSELTLTSHLWAGPPFGQVRFPFFIAYFFIVVFACSRGVWLPGRPDVFPDRGRVHHRGLLCQGLLVHCVCGSRSQLSFYLVCLHGLWFLHEKERGMFKAICGALSCQDHELSAGAHNVKVPRLPLWADSPAGV